MADQELGVGDAVLSEDTGDEPSLQDRLKEVIQVEVADVGTLRKKLTVTIPQATIEGELNDQYEELRTDAVVPGFRKGRAPRRLLEKRFGAEIGEQVGSNLVSQAYLAAIDRESIDALGDPLVHVAVKEKRHGSAEETTSDKLLPVDEALPHLKLPADGDFSFACEVEIRPTFDLPELTGIPVTKPVIQVSDEDVDNEIKRLTMLRGRFVPVENGKVKADDILVGNLTIDHDGTTVKNEDNAEIPARDQRYDGILLDGWGAAALGKKSGDVVECKVTIPDDHTEVDLRGKPATARLALLDIKRFEAPTLDEAFLTSLGFDDEAEFRAHIKERIETLNESETRSAMATQVTQYLMDSTDFDVPEGISQRQSERIVAREMMDLYYRGTPESEISKQVDELRTRAATQAHDDLKTLFIMEKIAEDRDIAVSEEEVNSAIAEIAQRRNQRFDRVRDEIISTNHLSTLHMRLREQKILEALLADAKVTEGAPPKAKAKKKSAAKSGTKKAAKKSTKKSSSKKDGPDQDAG